jgi:hypothetical protein
MLAFIIPVKHPARSNSYEVTLDLLRRTLDSVEAQTDPRFAVVVVCNERPAWGSDNARRMFVEVDFPPAAPPAERGQMHSWGFLDKGAKLAVGLLHARRFNPTHVMFVDADDFVSRRLASYVAANPAAPGWYVDEGLFYSKQFKVAEVLEKFWSLCGTSHILRADLVPVDLDLAAAVSPPAVVQALGQFYVERVLGCHLDFKPHVAKMGVELSPLPFHGAVWQADTGENSSRTWWKYTRFGPVWGKPLAPEESLDFTIPIEQRRALDTAILFGWRARSLLKKGMTGPRRLKGLLQGRSAPDRRV